MTSEEVRSELEKEPFVQFRLHLASGKTLDVNAPRQAELLQNSLLLFHERRTTDEETLYDVVSLRNVERLEQIKASRQKRGSG